MFPLVKWSKTGCLEGFPKAEVTDSNSVWGTDHFVKRFAGKSPYQVM